MKSIQFRYQWLEREGMFVTLELQLYVKWTNDCKIYALQLLADVVEN